MKKLFNITAFLLLSFLFIIIAAPQAEAETDGMIRVKLTRLGNVSVLNFTTNCDYALNGNSSVKIASGSKVTVKLTDGNFEITVGSKSKSMGASFNIQRMSAGNKGVRFNGSNNIFAGDLYFSKNGSYIQTVLKTYIENYLLGVVGYEMSDGSAIEALKAQAVCARTYAMRAKSTKGSWDVDDTTSYQVFKGYPESYTNVAKAVKATENVVLWYNGKYAATYYGSSNGGQTEATKNVWGSNISYLTVKDDPYDFESSGTTKKGFVPSQPGKNGKLNSQIESAIKSGCASKLKNLGLSTSASDIKIEEIVDLIPNTPKYPEPSYLYTKIRFNCYVTSVDSNGKRSERVPVGVDVGTYSLIENALSLSINSGSNETVFVEKTDNGFNIIFKRCGHGVGMSQWGAKVMASRYGKNYAEILDFYFHGTELKKLDLKDSSMSGIKSSGTAESLNDSVVYKALKYGDSGTDVKTLQARLKALGYFGGEVLGNYKTQTEGAVKLFQKQLGVKQDGVATSELLAKIYDDDAPKYGQTKAAVVELPAAMGQVIVTSDSVNVFESASNSSECIGTLKKGAVVDLLKYNDTWVWIAKDGKNGYAKKSAFEKYEPAEEASEKEPTPAPASVTTQKSALFEAKVKTSKSTVYASAKTSAKKLGTLKKGAVIEVLAYKNGWAQVRKGTNIGYMKVSTLVKVTTAAPKTITAVTKSTVKLYKSASASAKAYGTIKKGQKVEVVAVKSSWAKAVYKGYTGYIPKKYLTAG